MAWRLIVNTLNFCPNFELGTKTFGLYNRMNIDRLIRPMAGHIVKKGGGRQDEKLGKIFQYWTRCHQQMTRAYTVRKITSYNLYLCGLHRIPCIDQDYNLQNIILVYPANIRYIQHIRCISTEYFECQSLFFCLFVKCFGVSFHSPHSSESRVISYMCFHPKMSKL